MLQSSHDLSVKYFPRKNTEKPENVDQKFELVSLTHISNVYILWETPETIFGRNSNNIYDVFWFGRNGFADFDLKYFPFCQGNFLQNTWLLSTVFGFVQQKQAKSWLKSIFVNCDSNLNIQHDKNLPVLKFQLGNPLKSDDWQNVELEDLRLAYKKDTGVWDCFVGCDWNKDALEFQDGDVAEPYQAKPYVGPFWMLYFEKAMADVVGSYGDLHGASLDHFDIFGALMKSPLVQTFEFQADDSKAAVDLFDSFSTYDGSEIEMVARIRKTTIVKEVVAKDGRLEILGQYDQVRYTSFADLRFLRSKSPLLKITRFPSDSGVFIV